MTKRNKHRARRLQVQNVANARRRENEATEGN